MGDRALESAPSPAGDLGAWADGYERCDAVWTSGGRSGSRGRGRRATNFTAWLAKNELKTIAVQRPNWRRRGSATAAPIAHTEYQTIPCSPSSEKRRTAVSTAGWCQRVRNCRSSAVSSSWNKGRFARLEADAAGLGVEPHERHLRQVDGHGRLRGIELVPAVARAVCERLAEPVVVVLGDAHAHAAAADEADLDAPVVVFRHQ